MKPTTSVLLQTAVAVLFPPLISAQPVMSSVAGTDWTFPSGQTRAIAAPLGRIFNFCIDRNDNLYVPDADNHLLFRVSASGTLTAIAGNGLPGYSGDGGPATEASLLSPRGCGVDSGGNVYIADTDNNRIRKVDVVNGTISTVAGNGLEGFSGDGRATAVRLFSPRDIVFDSADNMYIADTRNHRVRRLTPSGALVSVAGTGKEGYGGDGRPATEADLHTPDGIFLDGSGVLYIADTFNHRIRRVAANGTISTVLGPEAGRGTERLSYPKDIAVGAGGVLYVVDPGNNVIRRVAADGTVSVFAGNGQRAFAGDGGPAAAATLGNPVGILLDRAGNIVIADTENLRIRRVGTDGIIQTIAGNGNYRIAPEGSAAVRSYLSIPHSVAIGPDGNLYVADSQNHRVVRVGKDGAMTTVVGTGRFGYSGDGGQATRASIYYPKGVAVDRAGNLYVSDTLNSVIRKVTPQGIISTFAGTGKPGFTGDGAAATSADLNYPTGVSVDTSGNVYIADSLNHAIRMVSSQGIITTLAGTGTEGFSGDGGPARSARLHTPYRVTVDSTGNIYIADIYNHRIRRINTSGVIETIAGTGQPGPGGEGVQARQTAVYTPTAIVVDSAGNIYYTEQITSLVRRISPSGIVNTIAGTGRTEFSGDGRIATEASMYWPLDLAMDPQGNLYVADSMNHRIRLLLATPPEVATPVQTLTFSAEAGGGRTASQPVNISGAIPGISYVVRTSTSAGGLWLRVSPESGGLPATLEATVDPERLEAGTYSGTITVETPNAAPRSRSIAVRLQVSAGRPPSMVIEKDRLTFAYTGQSASALTQHVGVRNAGGGSLAFNIRKEGGAWLSVQPSAAEATATNPAIIAVTADPADLTPGTYEGAIFVTRGDETQKVGVTMTITGSQPKLTLSQAGLTFRVVQSGGLPLPQTIGILNSGQGQMRWNASASTLGGGGPWLSIGQTSGTLATPLTDVALLEVRVDATGLAPGDYYGRVDVTAADNTKHTVSVVLNVLAPGSKLPPEVRPNGLIFTGEQGSTPGSQSVFIANRNTEAVTFASSRLTITEQPWFVHVPATGALYPNQPVRFVVQPDFSKLPAGVHQGSVSVLFSDGTIESIPVLSVVAAPGASAAKDTRAAGGCTPTFLKMVLSGGKSSWTTQAGQPANLETQVVDNCGQPVTNSGRPSSVTATFVGDNSLEMRHIGQGRWSNTYQPRAKSAGRIRGYITAFVFLPNNQVLADQVEVSVDVQSGAAVPLIAPGEVRNAASLQRNAPLAPGSLVTIFGSSLSTGNGEIATAVPLPREIGGTEVRLGDRPLPLLYAGENQINAQVPYDLPLNSQHQLIIRRTDALSVPEEFTVAPVQPAVFAMNQRGFGQGAVVNARTNVLADPANPGSRGDVLTIYCTGLGIVEPGVLEGSVAPANPLSRTRETPVVTIGGVPAQVAFAGLSPGSAGLYQVNVSIPNSVPTGDEVPIVITMGGVDSNTTTIAIR